MARAAAERCADLTARGRTAPQIYALSRALCDPELQKLAEEIMAKKDAAKREVAASQVTGPYAVREIPLYQIAPSALNRKLSDDDPELQTLALSMQRDGLIQPIVVRPGAAADEYEIVVGERRWRAARRLQWATIPAIVRQIDDDDAQVQRVIENLQRLDVPPLEQAAGVKILLDRHTDAAEVAARLGQTEAWVRTRAKLTNLSPAWRQELADPEGNYPALASFVTWQEELAKLPAATQDLLLAQHALRACGDLDEVRKGIGRYLREVKAAPWPAAQDREKPCGDCPERSDREALLFAEYQKDAPGAQCLNPACWESKVYAWLRRRAKTEARKYPVFRLLSADFFVYPEARRKMAELVGEYSLLVRGSYDREKQEDHMEALGLFIDGPEIGESVTCWLPQEAAETEDEAESEKLQQEEESRRAKWREVNHLKGALAEQLRKLEWKEGANLTYFVAAFGVVSPFDEAAERDEDWSYPDFLQVLHKNSAEDLFGEISRRIIESILGNVIHCLNSVADIQAVAEAFSLDFAELQKAAQAGGEEDS